MDERWTLGILGLYTIIYLVVFFIQKAQIDQQKNLINSMKSFTDIFNVSDVKEYVELKMESANLKAVNLIENDDKIKELVMETGLKMAEDVEKEVRDLYIKEMGDKHLELLKVVLQVIVNQKPEKRKEFISDLLPKNEHYLLPMLKEHFNNKKI